MKRMVKVFHLLIIVWLADVGFTIRKLPTFFNKRRQRCNCAGKKVCHRNGTCSPDICKTEFVGVTCQHASIEIIKSLMYPLDNILTDGKVNTCVSFAKNSKLTYEIPEAVYIFWVYIYTETKITSKSVSMIMYLNGTYFFPSAYYFYINENSVLLKFEYDNIRLNKIEFTNFGSICSLEIGIGRNVALFAHTTQSSMRKKYLGINAVDGYEENMITDDPFVDFNGRPLYCTHTESRGKNNVQWWQARLQFDARVNIVQLLNRNKEKCRLRFFTLELQNDNESVFTKVDNGTQDVDRYSIPVGAPKPVRTVRVSIDKNNAPKNCSTYGSVTLCEVSVFGEFNCPANMFGPLCETYCPTCSQDTHKCDPDWGCARKCDFGGGWCVEACSPHCAGTKGCNRFTLECDYGCERGYYPPLCTDRCIDGYYGLRCSRWCAGCVKNASSRKGTCDHRSGTCFHGCLEGFIGQNCVKHVVRESLMMYLVKTFSGAFILGILALVFYFSTLGRRHFVKKRASEGWWSGDTFEEEENPGQHLDSAKGQDRTDGENDTAEHKVAETPRKNDLTNQQSFDSSTDSDPFTSVESYEPSEDSHANVRYQYDFNRKRYDVGQLPYSQRY